MVPTCEVVKKIMSGLGEDEDVKLPDDPKLGTPVPIRQAGSSEAGKQRPCSAEGALVSMVTAHQILMQAHLAFSAHTLGGKGARGEIFLWSHLKIKALLLFLQKVPPLQIPQHRDVKCKPRQASRALPDGCCPHLPVPPAQPLPVHPSRENPAGSLSVWPLSSPSDLSRRLPAQAGFSHAIGLCGLCLMAALQQKVLGWSMDSSLGDQAL
ncbi:uncharacterized protein [Symphalangus syndactylus]|uniref:uncharacterized protein n=1 Tax=Symphalangus syndactylus TaxID=9590 RepID=UPI002441F600|nr:uncharacterized protein LOC129463778 [Symphalangus syndactylus]